MLVFKILTADEWQVLERDGESPGAAVDVTDGFVHFSTAAQVAATAEKHFAGRDGLMLLAVDAERLGAALRWEPARGGDLFPHLYAPLRRADLAWARPLPLGPDGVHLFPEGVA